MRGAGKHRHRNLISYFLSHHFMEQQGSSLFNALGHAHQDSTGCKIFFQNTGSSPHSKGWRGQHDQTTVTHCTEITGQHQFFRQPYPFELRILALLSHGTAFLFAAADHRDFISVFQQHQRQSRTPTAAANNRCFHLVSSRFTSSFSSYTFRLRSPGSIFIFASPLERKLGFSSLYKPQDISAVLEDHQSSHHNGNNRDHGFTED